MIRVSRVHVFHELQRRYARCVGCLRAPCHENVKFFCAWNWCIQLAAEHKIVCRIICWLFQLHLEGLLGRGVWHVRSYRKEGAHTPNRARSWRRSADSDFQFSSLLLRFGWLLIHEGSAISDDVAKTTFCFAIVRPLGKRVKYVRTIQSVVDLPAKE